MDPYLKDSWSGSDLPGLWVSLGRVSLRQRVRSHGHQEEEDRYSRHAILALLLLDILQK